MTYLAQFKPHGCRNWRDLGNSRSLHRALADLINTDSSAKRVRILQLSPKPKTIATAFYCEPKVIFEGESK